MDFELTENQRMIANAAREIATEFGPEYWRKKEEKHEFGSEFWKSICDAGFPGIVIPEEYGGSGNGATELFIAMENLSGYGCGMAGAWYLILSEVFGGLSILKHGTAEQKKKYLPPLARGDMEFCMALTEPNAGTNTLNISTTARKEGKNWVINGNKTFISGADRAQGMLIIARTSPGGSKGSKTSGLSLFLADLPNKAVEIEPIAKHAVNYSHSCTVTFNDLKLPESALMPPLDGGWHNVLDTLNPERMSFSALGVGIANLAIRKAVEYARERKVFNNVPIGSYQALQFPLAESYSCLEAARLLNLRASVAYDSGKPSAEVGAAANMAKAIVVEHAIKAVYWAMQVFGGYGYAVEYDVERWWREINLIRLAPVTQQMTLAYIGERVLGLPKSYQT
jgi:acyl-CoA dehydrogenase